MDFIGNFLAARHISRANCTKFTTDRPRQVAYEIFSIECRFQRSRFRPSRKFAHEGVKERYPLKVIIWLLLASLPWKRLQIGRRRLY